MTMIVQISLPMFEEPIEKELDLDSTADATAFVNQFGDLTFDLACYLYPGEKIVIECIHRNDEAMF